MSPIDKRIAKALRDAPKSIIAFAALMEKLAEIMIREIDVVSKRRLHEHPELLKQKQRLAMDYRASFKAIGAQPEIVKSLSQEAKEALREMAQRLAMAVDENARVLRAAVDATRRLIQNIVSMIKTEVLPTSAYKNTATAHMQLGQYSPTCRPVALSRTV